MNFVGYDFKWRKPAKIIAWVDLVLSVLDLVHALVTLYLEETTENKSFEQTISNNATVGESEEVDLDVSGQPAIVAILAGITLLFIAIMLIGFWSIIKLIRATDVGRETNEAFKQCRFWQIVSIVGLAFSFLGTIFGGGMLSWIIFAIALIIRGTFMLIVFSFMRELKKEHKINPETAKINDDACAA